ncbi:hypothetical protein KQX54_011207 [Cotesia glomerata]|uniref:Uncharacterized protein n=1 Tax=Cotesia glomerata TaxID=32391 RepID=A0AAV7J328_COTGL|nr:hypothetical protein KQX54_011207 [Cotesia glomerata]
MRGAKCMQEATPEAATHGESAKALLAETPLHQTPPASSSSTPPTTFFRFELQLENKTPKVDLMVDYDGVSVYGVLVTTHDSISKSKSQEVDCWCWCWCYILTATY